MEAVLHILHMEDAPPDTELALQKLRKEGVSAEIDRVATREAFQQALERKRYTLILCDYTIPGTNTPELLRLARQMRPEVPFVFFSGTMGEDLGIEMLKLGASDYVLKQRPERLVPAVRRAVAEAEEHARRQQLEENLRQSEERFRIMANAIPQLAWMAKADGYIYWYNRRCFEYTGAAGQALEGWGWQSVVAPEALPGVLEQWKASIAAGQPLEMVFPLRGADGRLRRFLTRVQPLKDAQGRVVQWFGTNTDVEELKRAEQRLRATFDNAAAGMVETDDQDCFVAVNGRLCQMLGYRREELLGRSVRELTDPEDRPRTDALNAQLRAGHAPMLQYEKRYLKRDGSPLWVQMAVSAVRDDAGRYCYSVGTVVDVSERKAAEAELRAAQASAERARAAAEEASKAKDDFLAVLSHELRTPLTPVVTALSMLQGDKTLDGPTQERLEMVRRNVELEARLIDDLLDVTRIARGKIELERKPIRLCEVLDRAVEVIWPDIEARRLHFGVDIQDGPYIVEADAIRLQQVFWNLLRNAVKFTPHGGCVSVCARKLANSHVRVDVQDSGEGLEPEALGRIFNAFEQVERSVTRQFGGLGLGLAISKALVELHGGTIEAHSPGKGQGATFRVCLPLAAAPPQPKAPPAATPSAVRALYILLVEDHGDTAKVMRQLLMMEGHTVEQAGDVATALELVHRHQFDLLISDLGLPDRSGLDLIRELRACGSILPAIALSGYGREEDIRRSREAGFAIHLTKPTSPAKLAEAIAAVTAIRTGDTPL